MVRWEWAESVILAARGAQAARKTVRLTRAMNYVATGAEDTLLLMTEPDGFRVRYLHGLVSAGSLAPAAEERTDPGLLRVRPCARGRTEVLGSVRRQVLLLYPRKRP